VVHQLIRNSNKFIQKYGQWAVVTGASSGIGEEFTYQLSAAGINLVLIARSENKLMAIAEKIKDNSNVEVRVVCTDLSNDGFIQDIVAVTNDIDVGLLINSAGFAVTGDFTKNDIAMELAQFNVNSRAPLLLSHHFSNKMLARGRGGIIFLSSVVAFSATRGWAGYAASKSHNLLLSETMAYELAPHNVDVLTLCPGATRTNFLTKAGLKDNVGSDVSSVVGEALSALGSKKIVIPGFINKYNNFWSGILPRKFNVWVSSLILEKYKAGK